MLQRYFRALADSFVPVGILGRSYMLPLGAQLVVTLRNANKYFWHHCRGTVAVSIFEPSGPRIYLFRFLLPSPPLPIEMSFLVLLFYIYPRYPLRCLPFKASLPHGVSPKSHHHLHHLAMNSPLAF